MPEALGTMDGLGRQRAGGDGDRLTRFIASVFCLENGDLPNCRNATLAELDAALRIGLRRRTGTSTDAAAAAASGKETEER